MSTELEKILASYRVLVVNEGSGQSVTLKAIVTHNETAPHLCFIWYSHTMLERENSAGPYISGSYTHASDVAEAEYKIKKWAKMMSVAHKIEPWTEDL